MRVARALGLALALGASGAGCQHSIPRLVERGEFAAAAAKAAKARRIPKGRAARAWAAALEGLGRYEEARAVLLRDFRTSGEVGSMIALAELEAAQGLVGVATVHFERAASLEPGALRGHVEMCELLRRRARAFAALDEAIAGDQDMRRVAFLCPEAPGDAALAGALRGAAAADVKKVRALAACAGEGCAGEGGAEDGLAAARAEGPAALRRWAAARGQELAAADVIRLLSAEIGGEAGIGVDLIGQDELRGWIGEAPMESLMGALDAADEATQAYVRLRLGRMGAGYSLPVAEGEAGSEAALVTRALEALDAGGPARAAMGWRVMVMIGDLPGAEMAVASGLRAIEGGAGGSRESTLSHWGARVKVTAATVEPLLVLARMRGIASGEAQGLEIARYVVREGRAQGIDEAAALGAIEAHHALASGRPWQALALADALGGGPVERAAAAAIVLGRAACEGGCAEASDRAAAVQVMGDAWGAAIEARLVELAAGPASPGGAPGCPSAGEAVAAGGALGEALRLAREPGSSGFEAAARAAIESDIALICAGRLLAPVMLARGQRVGARGLADALSQGPQTVAAGILALQGELALVGGREEQALVMFTAAAGASVDPRAVWRRAAWFARLADAREVELAALREILLHGARGAAATAAHQALVVRALRDANQAWALREGEIGRETVARAVDGYVAAAGSGGRWQAREALARVLAEETWSDAQAAAIVRRALWPEPELAGLHPAASARLEAALAGRAPALGRVDPLAGSELALAAAEPGFVAPASARFLPAAALAEVQVALARRRPEDAGSRRAAIAAATSGPPGVRTAALRGLLGGFAAGDPRRREIEALVLGGLPALAEPGGAVEPMVAEAEALLTLVFGAEARTGAERKRPPKASRAVTVGAEARAGGGAER